jgi:glycosyltransferase involved in cell wall biosynthesis
MQSGVCVGVAVHAEPAHLAATISFFHAHTDPDVQLVLLPDGPDEPTAAALTDDAELAAIEQWATPEPRGMAACFNRLASRSSAGVVVLLESGTLVGPRWLELLRDALDRDGCGLAGPSTNLSWNEQGIQCYARGDAAAIRRDAAHAIRRFGAAARTLEPLYSLADFCYAVRREVIEAIGLADEAYGVGPCWEMDYNIRAARAGFRGVWVGASYVYRSPPTRRRHEAEAAKFEANRRLYQDRFCGLRLRGETTLYRPHCLGDACEHFAPAGLLPAPKLRTKPAAISAPKAAPAGMPPVRPAVAARPVSRPAEPQPVVVPMPLVSCIMPTRERADFARQAVRYFQRQDYPNTELVIIENGPPVLAASLPDDPRIRLIPSDTSRSIGALRNIACQHARGEIVVQWDDDDWHGPKRLSRQVADIRAGEADITALRDALVFDLERWQFWRLSARLHRQMFVRDVHGGTLAFRRWVWERLARYPDRSLAEDAAFLDQAVRRGARLRAQSADGLFLYLRHSSNSWWLDGGRRDGWEAQPEPDLPPEDRVYYARHCPAAPGPVAASQPLVSCIMPTMDRRVFIPRAIEYFRRQDYPAKELVILDDGRDPVVDLVPAADPAIVYQRLDHRVVLGAKRNLACQIARGTIIAHWDDDDWQARHRLSVQVSRMVEGGHDLCGSRALRFYNPARSQAWRYEWPRGQRVWAAGPSLCYSKELWTRSPFPEVGTGEDSRFVWSKAVRSVCDVSETDSLIAIIHPGNTVPKTVNGVNWSRIPVGEVEQLLGPDLDFYRDPWNDPEILDE